MGQTEVLFNKAPAVLLASIDILWKGQFSWGISQLFSRKIAIISLGISWGTISVGIFPEGSSYGIIGIIPPKTGEEGALSRVLQMVGHRFQLSRARHDKHVAWEQTSSDTKLAVLRRHLRFFRNARMYSARMFFPQFMYMLHQTRLRGEGLSVTREHDRTVTQSLRLVNVSNTSMSHTTTKRAGTIFSYFS